MYTPSSFKEDNPEILFELIENNSFGVLFSQHTERPEATHLPFMVNKRKRTLIAHFAKANKHWKKLSEEKEILVIFQGPHTYVSPSWYVHRDEVPTWNYATVHVYGKPRLIHDSESLRKMVTELTHLHESNIESDWDLREASESFEIDLKAIVGIEIEISEMEGKFKFNQNKSKEDQEDVIKNLDNLGLKEVSEIMKKNLAEKK